MHPLANRWYAQQDRFRVHYHAAFARWIIHDTAIGCQWAAHFLTRQDAIEHLHHERTRSRGTVDG